MIKSRSFLMGGIFCRDFLFLREPLLPNQRVCVRIWFNDNPAFYMSQNPTDSKKYKLKINEAILHATVMTPSPDLKKVLYPRIRASSLKDKVEAVYYHYQETAVLTESIMNVSSYQSQNFAKNGVTPNRIYIVFVKTTGFAGSRKNSPYDFRYVHLCDHVAIIANLCQCRRLFEVTGTQEGPIQGINVAPDETDDDISDSEAPISAEEFRAALEAEIQESGVVNRGMVRRTLEGLRNKFFRKKGPASKTSARRDSFGSASLPGTSAAASGAQTPATRRQVAVAAAAATPSPAIPPSYRSTESISYPRDQGKGNVTFALLLLTVNLTQVTIRIRTRM